MSGKPTARAHSNAISGLASERDNTLSGLASERDNAISGLASERDNTVSGLASEGDNAVSGLTSERDNAMSWREPVPASIPNGRLCPADLRLTSPPSSKARFAPTTTSLSVVDQVLALPLLPSLSHVLVLSRLPSLSRLPFRSLA